MQKYEIDIVSIVLHKVTPMDQRLQCKSLKHKVLEENILSTLEDSGVDMNFLNKTLFAQKLRPAVDK